MYDTSVHDNEFLHAERQRSLPWMVGLLVIAAVVGGAFMLGVGRTDEGPVEQLPASPVQGMADPGASALPAGGDDETAGRPVLEVTAGDGGAQGPTTVPPASTVAPSTASSAPPTSAPTTSSVPPADDPAPDATAPGSDDGSSVPSSTSSMPAPTDDLTTMPPEAEPTTTTGVPDDGLNPVELELARLTNELRTNPNGPLRREGAVINCEERVPIDPETGGYLPVAPLTVDTVASVQVARDWSSQLTTDLQHRPQAGIEALQGAGIDIAAAGENIAYHNFPDTAMRHFVGWRESDGHFCNMMDPTFTHIGVGEVTRPDGFSFATQNFFALRSAE